MDRPRNSSKFIQLGKNLLAAFNAVRLFPHIIVFMWGRNGEIMRADLARYGNVYGTGKTKSEFKRIILFVNMMTFIPEYRNVFYLRLDKIGYVLGVLCPPMATLKINVKRCGPGLFIQHGFGTTINAREIGANCWINQHVTIGDDDDPGKFPKLGNHVTIAAGARVLGDVTVEDNAVVAANSVAVSNVPTGATAIGVPAKLFRLRRKMGDM